MARTKGSYSLSANIEINAAAPLDARERVSTLADLTAEGSFPYHYVGMETYVVATGKKYRLTGSDPTVSANWTEIGEGGSGSGGHTIEDASGTDMTARTNLQFKGAATVADDSTNDRTIVDVPTMTSEDMSEIIDPLPTPVLSPDLDDLGDVDITSPTNGQVLKYNSSNSTWVNANESGGGGGSTVTITPSLGSGTKVADYSVDGVSGSLYAPTPTDVEANPSETATANLTKLQVGSTVYGISEGTNVVANPSGTGTADLTKLQVGNTIYDIPEGTEVEANPSGTATTDLTKLQVGSTIYSIPDTDTDALADLTDVTVSTPTNGQVLKYNSTSSKWENANESGSSSGHTIEDGTGTDMTARANLQFKGAASVSDDSTNDRTIVDVPKMTSEDMTEIIDPLPTPISSPDVEDLGDVSISSLANGQILKYNSSTSKWENANESGGGGGSTVAITPSLVSGTKVADYSIDGVSGSMYAPTPTDVEANPSGTATTDLTKLQVGSTVYSIPDTDTDALADLTDVSLGTPTNGQVLKYNSSSAKWENANESGGGGGGGGHTIEDSTGTAMTARSNLQFDGVATVSDDSINDRTIVDVPEMPSADMSSIVYPLPTPVQPQGTVATSVPVGTIISVMGNQAPINFLVCDGTVYNIADYEDLAEYFEDQFGSANYFGGNGTTTFAVPDLQGEFLRGSGENSHLNQGDGGDVGDHQDATIHNTIDVDNKYFAVPGQQATRSSPLKIQNPDKKVRNGYDSNTYVGISNGTNQYDTFQQYTSRPTNTSVLYCIAIKDIPSGVGGSGASQLYELADVRLFGVQNGEVLKYNSYTSRWENAPDLGDSLSTLNDVVITNPQEDQTIHYDATSGKWINRPIESPTATIYGFKILRYETDPLTKVEYVKDAIGMVPAYMDYTLGEFNYGSWENAFFMPKPCMVKYDGTVDYYLDPDDYSLKADGTPSDVADPTYPGNAMMEWGQNGKKIWLKVEPDYANDSKSATILISDENADGKYTDWPFHNSAGESVDHFYTAIYNASLIDGKFRSLSGQNLSKSLTREQEYNYAIANNPENMLLWTPEVLADIQLIEFLLILISKGTNLQDRFGQGIRSGGTETKNNSFLTGVNNTKGLFYGTNNTSTSNYTTDALKVFGMENWWGIQYRSYWGDMHVNYDRRVKLTYNREDGSGVVGYNVTGEGYVSLNIPSPSGSSGGYISEMKFTDKGMYISTLGGSSSTHYCDGCHTPGSGVRFPHRGGYPDNGALVGPFMRNLAEANTYTIWRVSTSLSCKPLSPQSS